MPDNRELSPHSVEAEEAVLGSILLDPSKFYDVSSFLRPDDFFIARNNWIYDAIWRISARDNGQVDYLTVTEELKAKNQLEEIGGSAYITKLLNHTPSSIYADTYGHIVERAAIRRRMLSAASTIAQAAHDGTKDIHDVITACESAISKATSRTYRRDTVRFGVALQDRFEDVKARFEAVQRGESKFAGVPTGFREVDAMTGGLQKSDLIIVAGRPGMGKTAYLLSLALNAVKTGACVLILSMEMTREQVIDRLCSMESGISTDKFRSGDMTPTEFAQYEEAVNRLKDIKLYVDDMAGLNPQQMRAKVSRAYYEHGVNLVLVDYLQLMEGSSQGTKYVNRTQDVGEISRALKLTARDLNIPVLAAAQINRAVEGRADKRPMLSDLRESGSIEQDSDIVMFLYRDEVYNEATERPNECDVIIAKHRNGPTGTVALYFRKELTKFGDLRKAVVDLTKYDGSNGRVIQGMHND
jgi:replicative DNA helicase